MAVNKVVSVDVDVWQTMTPTVTVWRQRPSGTRFYRMYPPVPFGSNREYVRHGWKLQKILLEDRNGTDS